MPAVLFVPIASPVFTSMCYQKNIYVSARRFSRCEIFLPFSAYFSNSSIHSTSRYHRRAFIMATSDGVGTISADEVKQRKLDYAGNAVQYSSAMGTAVTHRYDGQDRPGSRDIEFSRPGAAQKKRLDRKTAAIIHLHNAGEHGFSYGTLNSVGVKAPCHVAYHASSQTPGIQLHVNMDAERTIFTHIFCQALHRSVQADRSTVKLSFKMRYGNDLALEEEIPMHNPELMEHAGDKTLLELRFRIWGTDTRPYDLPGGPTPGPVIFTGISAHELKDLQIRCCADGAAKNDAEMLIAWLSCCPEDLEISVQILVSRGGSTGAGLERLVHFEYDYVG